MEEKLKSLRKRWKNEPSNRKIIEIQAKLLKMAQDVEKFEKQMQFERDIKEVFGDTTQTEGGDAPS